VYFFDRTPWELGFHGFWVNQTKLQEFLKKIDKGFSQSRLGKWKAGGVWCLVLGIHPDHMERGNVHKIPDREGQNIPMSVIRSAMDPDPEGNYYIKRNHNIFDILLAFEIVKGGRDWAGT